MDFYNKNDKIGIANTCKLISQYLKRNINSNILLLLFILMGYGIRLSYYTVGLDTAGMMSIYKEMIEHYITIGRFGVSFTKILLGFTNLQPWELSFLTILFLYIAVILWGFVFSNLFQKNDESSQNCTWIMGALFVTAPLLAEQFMFTLQSFEVALALNLCALALWLSYKNKKIYSIMLLAYAIGTYQSFVVIYIIAAITAFLLSYDFTIWKQKKRIILTQSIICIGGVALYYIINKLTTVILGISSSQYLEDSFIAWGKQDFDTILNHCLLYIKSVFEGSGIFYNGMYAVCVISLFLIMIYKICKKRKLDGLLILTMIGYMLSPFLLTIFLGNVEPVRAQFQIPFWIGCASYIIVSRIQVTKAKLVCCFICAIISFRQANLLETLFYTDYIRQRSDERLATQIMDRIYTLGVTETEIENMGIVFVGEKSALLNSSTIKGEMIGKSHFEFGGGGSSSTGCTNFLIVFLKTEGYEFRNPSVDEMEEGLMVSKNMPAWPLEGSVAIFNDIVVVKLS